MSEVKGRMRYCRGRQWCELHMLYIWLGCEGVQRISGRGFTGPRHYLSPGMVYVTFPPFEMSHWLCLCYSIIWNQTGTSLRGPAEGELHPAPVLTKTHMAGQPLPGSVLLHHPHRQYRGFEG